MYDKDNFNWLVMFYTNMSSKRQKHAESYEKHKKGTSLKTMSVPVQIFLTDYN